MPNVKNTILDDLLSVVAPHLCSGCGRIGSAFCSNCKYNIVNEPYLGCIICGKHELKGVCEDHKVSFNQAWVVGVRSDALQRLIGGFKFRNIKAAAKDLAYLLDQRLPLLPQNIVFVPIPTARSHVRERGYDHVLLITKHLASRRRRPVSQILKRNNSFTQHHANRNERQKQAADAYRMEGVVDPTKVYILVDDILTTGSTMKEAALVLKNAGATVWVAVIARQPLD